MHNVLFARIACRATVVRCLPAKRHIMAFCLRIDGGPLLDVYFVNFVLIS